MSGSSLRVLRDASFWPYFAGNLASNCGTWFQNLAQAVLIYRLTGSTFLVGMLAFVELVPLLTLTLVGGALADALGDVPAQLAEIIDVDALEFRFRTEFELDANWKVACENFLECYHCAVAHPGFAAAVDVSPDAYRLETDGLTSSQFGPLRDGGRSFLADGELPRSQFHFVWPNFGINVFPGQPNLSRGPIVPLGPERTARFLDYFFAPDVDDEWVAELLEFDAQVGREDRVLVENVQRGVGTGLIERGRLLPESERLVAHFDALVERALA